MPNKLRYIYTLLELREIERRDFDIRDGQRAKDGCQATRK